MLYLDITDDAMVKCQLPQGAVAGGNEKIKLDLKRFRILSKPLIDFYEQTGKLKLVGEYFLFFLSGRVGVAGGYLAAVLPLSVWSTEICKLCYEVSLIC